MDLSASNLSQTMRLQILSPDLRVEAFTFVKYNNKHSLPQFSIIVTALLSHMGPYLIPDTPEGGLKERGLIREEDLFTKSNDKDSFSVLLPRIFPIKHTILQVKSINSTQFSPLTI